jgi:hypothetical protein
MIQFLGKTPLNPIPMASLDTHQDGPTHLQKQDFIKIILAKNDTCGISIDVVESNALRMS